MSAHRRHPADGPRPELLAEAQRQPAPADAGQQDVRDGVTIAAAALAVVVLFILVYYAAYHGVSQLSGAFFTAQLPAYGGIGGGGGIGPALVGTAEVVLIATAIAFPVGVLTAIYLSEFASRARRQGADDRARADGGAADDHLRRLHLRPDRRPLRPVGRSPPGLALAIVEVPLIARASLESLRRVPGTLREAADALGVASWRTVIGVILPTAANGIVTATILAVARAAGETAPVLLTFRTHSGRAYQLNPLHAVPTIPVEILQPAELGRRPQRSTWRGAPRSS